MKLNILAKYQLSEMKYVFIVLYGIILFFILLGWQFFSIGSAGSSLEMCSSITFFVTAISCFSELFEMWIQNGCSRKYIFKGLLIGTFFISAICSILDYILAQFFTFFYGSTTTFSLISYLFTDYFSKHNILFEILLNLIFAFMIGSSSIMLGYTIAISFYRSGKFMRIGIAAGLPIFAFGLLPIIITVFHETAAFQAILLFLYRIIGLERGNPLYLIATISVVFLILASVNYLLIRKLQVRTS